MACRDYSRDFRSAKWVFQEIATCQNAKFSFYAEGFGTISQAVTAIGLA
jgi:hypothetical protein